MTSPASTLKTLSSGNGEDILTTDEAAANSTAVMFKSIPSENEEDITVLNVAPTPGGCSNNRLKEGSKPSSPANETGSLPIHQRVTVSPE